MKYSLRSLMIAVILAPPLLAGVTNYFLATKPEPWDEFDHLNTFFTDHSLPNSPAPTPNPPKP